MDGIVQKNEKGSVILEAALVIPIFLFLILGIYGLFVVSAAHNQISHALIQSSESLAMDSYITEKGDSIEKEGNIMWSGLSGMAAEFIRIGTSDPSFTSFTDWYNGGGNAEEIAKKRFVGFLTGGDEAAANERLKQLRVIDGLDGVKFTVEIEDEDVTVKLSYTLQLWFDFFDVGKYPVEESYKFKLWK